jgi:hypothetical protein
MLFGDENGIAGTGSVQNAIPISPQNTGGEAPNFFLVLDQENGFAATKHGARGHRRLRAYGLFGTWEAY